MNFIFLFSHLHEGLRATGALLSLNGDETRPWLSILAGGATAIVGGFAGSWLSEHFASKRRKIEALKKQKASAFRLHLQLLGMYSDLCQFRENLGQSRVAVRGSPQGHAPFRAQHHRAFSGEQSPVHFQVDDLQELASYGGDSLLNVVADLDRRFNAAAAALNQYRAVWLDVGAQIEGDVRGPNVIMSLDKAGLRKLGPKFASLSALLDDLDPMVDELVAESFAALVGVYQARVKAHGLRKPFEGIAPTGQFQRIEPDPNAEPPRPRQLTGEGGS